MKRLISVAIIIVLMIVLAFENTYAQDEINLEAKAALLMEAGSGEVILEKNIHQQLPPASITKMMTYLIAMEAVKTGKVTMEDEVRISSRAAKEKGASYKLREGEKIKLGELIEVMMIVSANDAAWAIAEHVGGNVENFVQKMNEKAEELGMTKSYFVNPNGMPEPKEGNLMTARDIAVLTKYIIDYYEKNVLPLTDKGFFQNPIRNFYKENTNGLLKVLPEVDGLKTGYTDEAGYCLVSTMKVKKKEVDEQDFRLISVVLGTADEQKRVVESQKLLSYGYTHYTKRRILAAEEKVGQMNLWKIKELPMELKAKEDAWAVGPKKRLVKSRELILLPKISVPVAKGDKLGELKITLYNDRVITVDVVSDRDIKEISFSIYMKRFWMILQSLFANVI
ncbi:D-alanyl-D-alanine carboxypeptidase [Clostridiaceae bacterium 35-E11]